MEKDRQSLLATGFFDPKQTVYTESGVRGGIGLVFEVVERPLIKEIKFEGLTIDQSIALQSLKTIGVQTGDRYSSEKMNAAVDILKRLLEANGRHVAKVELLATHLDAMSINLDFVITN